VIQSDPYILHPYPRQQLDPRHGITGCESE